MTGVCQLLNWDTEFFGMRVARLNRAQPTAAEMRSALDWCAAENISCLYLLTGSNDPETTRLAEECGFHFADIRVTLERSGGDAPSDIPSGIRIATEEDVAALKSIAGVSHTDSRFYYDTGFPRERCDELYRVWIEKSCRGYAQRVFVAEHQGAPVGYITCHNDEGGRIGLLGVAENARGLGLGGRLISAALHYFAESKLQRVTVVTQGRNAAAQRLYTRHGFLPLSTELWYHRWFRQAE